MQRPVNVQLAPSSVSQRSRLAAAITRILAGTRAKQAAQAARDAAPSTAAPQVPQAPPQEQDDLEWAMQLMG